MCRHLFLTLVLVFSNVALGLAQEIAPAGKDLAKFFDSLRVDELWLPKKYVNWKTGEALDKPVTDNKPHTHCSALVAAACMKKDVYILRPPDHSPQFLANAQFDWLQTEGLKKGWQRVKSAVEAQRMANEGMLVVATLKESDPKRHGHIALVRPSVRSQASIEKDGPQIIQAGMENYKSATLREGFKHHPDAWRDSKIQFFAHAIHGK